MSRAFYARAPGPPSAATSVRATIAGGNASFRPSGILLVTSSASHPRPDPGFLAADVGGTHARLAWVRADAEGRPRLQAYAKYRCAAAPDLGSLLVEFSARLPGAVEAAVIASAGCPGPDGRLVSANLPWPLDPRRIGRQLGLDQVHLINDFQALAQAVAALAPERMQPLCGPEAAAPGPLLVIGPGTGLGTALVLPGQSILPTEAGQASLAVAGGLEQAVLEQLRGRYPHVSMEHALSGPGLLNLYTALAALRGGEAPLQRPEQVTAAALDGSDALARQALDLFCELLGSSVGDLVLAYRATAVVLAGGFVPQLHRFLRGSGFARRLVAKGAMQPLLEQVPVWTVDHGQLGVLGAAQWYLRHAARRGLSA